jgi:putative 4-mercaptohistidine N1-methyltranferase
MNIYETTRLVDEYLLFHYGSPEEILPHASGPHEALHFPVRTVIENIPASYRAQRALDVGCAVGRSAFELSRYADEVVGLDYSHAFIAAAQALQQNEELEYRRLEEASHFTTLTARRPTSGDDSGQITFAQGDATALPETLGTFDLVHAANLICRLPEPQSFLHRLPSLVRPGGLLILTTPCTWLAEFTRPEFWPTEPTLDWLKKSLLPHFRLEKAHDQPFLIRETARKFQWTVAQASVWRRAV